MLFSHLTMLHLCTFHLIPGRVVNVGFQHHSLNPAPLGDFSATVQQSRNEVLPEREITVAAGVPPIVFHPPGPPAVFLSSVAMQSVHEVVHGQ
ncbi:MAG: hypothetical protein LBT47_02360 [Deltaproteobacteria bacterium]|nr:hypothetical protein [Deltaproteobacteria bacterium]